jgi:hypothetical protein
VSKSSPTMQRTATTRMRYTAIPLRFCNESSNNTNTSAASQRKNTTIPMTSSRAEVNASCIFHSRDSSPPTKKKERKKGENKLHSVPTTTTTTTTTQLQRRTTNRGNWKLEKKRKNTEIIQGIWRKASVLTPGETPSGHIAAYSRENCNALVVRDIARRERERERERESGRASGRAAGREKALRQHNIH